MDIGQGHGIEGRYAGLIDPYGSEEFAPIILLPVPFDLTTTYRKGSDLGPAALIEASRNMELYDIETDSQAYLHGIYTAPPILAESSDEMVHRVYEETKLALDKGKFTVVLGGEHAVSYGTIKAHAEKFGPISILQLDAHADLQPAYEGDPWSHASVMARVREIPQVANIVSVGIRSMSHTELPFLNASDTFFAHELEGNWIDRMLARLEGSVYLTFDLDVFDSSLMPSTGTPEPGGLFWNETMQLLKRVIKEKHVVGFDVVELCPNPFNPAPDYLAAKLVYKLLSYQFQGVPCPSVPS